MGARSAKLQEITDDSLQYLPGPRGTKKQLGAGGNGAVYLARYNDQLVAVKKVHEYLLSEDVGEDAIKYRQEFMDEMDILLELKHPNILACLGGSIENNILLTEFVCKGDLYGLIEKRAPAVAWEANGARMALQTARAVAAMHEQKILHRDLKSLNILVGPNFDIKVGDVGLAKRLDPNSNALVVEEAKYSTLWAAPEVLNRSKEIDEASDVYSLGVIIWELYTQQIPWNHLRSEAKVIEAVCAGGYNKIPEDTPTGLRRLFERCWDITPANRPKAIEVAEHLTIVVADMELEKQKGRLYPRLLPENQDSYAKDLLALFKLSEGACAEQPPNVLLLGQVAEVVLAVLTGPLTFSAEVNSIGVGWLKAFANTLIGLTGFDSIANKFLGRAIKFAGRSGDQRISQLVLLQDRLLKQQPNDSAERPKLRSHWQSPPFHATSSAVKKLHQAIIAKVSDKDVSDARNGLNELEVLTRVRLSHDTLLRRLSSPTEPTADILASLHTSVANLVQINKFEEAWQLLIDASQAIQEFGHVVDGILPRLVALLPYFLRNPPTDKTPVLSSPLFTATPAKWQQYKTKLGQNREKLIAAAKSPTVVGEEFLQRQQSYTTDMRALLASIIRDAEVALGPAPCKFSFCALGSMSTEDMNLFSDVELLLLVEVQEAANWEEVSYLEPASFPGLLVTGHTSRITDQPMAAYFKNLFELIHFQVMSVGETNTISKSGELKSGFHLDDQGHPSELRLRGTPEFILKECKPPSTKLDDPLTYSFLSAVHVYGNDHRELLDEFENLFFEALHLKNDVKLPSSKVAVSQDGTHTPPLSASIGNLIKGAAAPSSLSASAPSIGNKSPASTPPLAHSGPAGSRAPASTNSGTLPQLYLWQRAITLQHMKFHVRAAQEVLKPGGFTFVADFDILYLKECAGFIKYALFDLCRYHALSTRSVMQAAKKLSAQDIGVISSGFATAIINLYAHLQKCRAQLHIAAGFQIDTIYVKDPPNPENASHAIMPSGTLPKGDLDLVKLGIWGTIRVLYYGLDCVLQEFDQLVNESAFPLDPSIELAEEARNLSTQDLLEEAVNVVRTITAYLVVTNPDKKTWRRTYIALKQSLLRGQFLKTFLMSHIETFKFPYLPAIAQELSMFPDSYGLRPLVTEVQYAWNASLEKLFSPEPRPGGIEIRTINDLKCTLTAELEARIFDAKGDIRPNVDRGRRPVHNLDTPEISLHLKANPEWPGMEFAVGRLADLISGGCTPQTTLWAVKRKNGTWYPLLVSKTIKGPTMQNVLMRGEYKVVAGAGIAEPGAGQAANVVKQLKLNSKQFSFNVILALLTNPEDGKSDNYVLQEENEEFRIYSIDNDHSFVPPRVRKIFGHAPLVKTILFCFNEMRTAVNAQVREEIQELTVGDVIGKWLEDIKVRDEQYQALFTSIQIEEFLHNPDEEKRICIPIYLGKEVVDNVYNKLQKLQELLGNSTSVTHWDLLANLEPALSKFYKNVLMKDTLSVAERFKVLAESEYKGEMIGGAGVTRTNISRTLESVLGDLPTIEQVRNSEKWTVAKAMEKLRALDQLMREVKNAKQPLLEGNAEPFRHLDLPCARQQVLNDIAFDTLTESQSRAVLRLISGFDYTVLMLGSTKGLDFARLSAILALSRSLLVLDLSQTQVGSDSLGGLLSTQCTLLTKLNLKNVPNLANFWHSSVLSRAGQPLVFKRLRRLWLGGCSMLMNLKLDAPALVDLDLSGTKVDNATIAEILTQCSLNRFVYPDGAIVLIKSIVGDSPIVAIDTDERFLLTGTRNGTLRYCDINSEDILRTVQLKKAKLDSVQLLTDDRTAVLLDKSEIQILDGKGEILVLIQVPCTAFRVSFDKLVAIYTVFHRGRQEPTVKPTSVWDVTTGQRLSELHELGSQQAVGKYCVHASGHLAAVGNQDGTATVWDLKTFRSLGALSNLNSSQISRIGSAKSVKSVIILPTMFLTGSIDTRVRFFNKESLGLDYDFTAHRDPVECLHVKGNIMASGGYGGDPTVSLWKINGAKASRHLRTFYGHTGPLVAVRVVSEQHVISLDGKKVVKVWKLQPVAEAKRPSLNSKGKKALDFNSAV